MNGFGNLRSHWGTLMVASAAFLMSACQGLGLQTPGAVSDVYAAAEGPDATAYATIGIYAVVVEEAATICADEAVPLSACAAFGDVSARVSPAVASSAELWGASFFYRQVISDYAARGEAAPDNILQAGAAAFAQASADWVVLKPQIEGAIDAARGLTPDEDE